MTSQEKADLNYNKYAIYFDIDELTLRARYPLSSNSHSLDNYKNTYRKIAKYMTQNGFLRQQGSGYISKKRISGYKIHRVISGLAQEMPWLSGCFKRLDITIAGVTHDFTDFFKNSVNKTKGIENTFNSKINENIDTSIVNRSINFDINQNLLKKHYPYPSKIHGPMVSLKAYHDIASFLKKEGFSYRQHSGYLSDGPITETEVQYVLIKMANQMSWLTKCISNLDVTYVGKEHDMLDFFNKKAMSYTKEFPKNTTKAIGIKHKENPIKGMSR